MSPSHGPTLGATLVTLLGQDFGFPADAQHQQFMHVDFHTGCMTNATAAGGGTPAPVAHCSRGRIAYHGHDMIQFYSPSGIGVGREVSLGIWDGATHAQSASLQFSYDPPSVDLVFPNPPAFEDEALQLIIRGENFGKSADAPQWTDHEKVVTVTISGEVCEGADRVPGQDSALQCSMQPQRVGHKNMSITVAGQAGSVPATDSRALYVVCSKGYYGREGETCLPCPRGAECDGYLNFEHTEPRSVPGWYNLNVTNDRCSHEERRQTRQYCNLVVPCEPKDACVGDNKCAVGYKSAPPIFRCSLCDDCYQATPGAECKRFYRRAGECIECPDAPLLLIIGFVIAAIGMCVVGYVLNRKAVNLAFFSIGVDYFQVLAMFANSRIQWPAMIEEMFHIFSVFNLNLEITAPECTIPDIGYTTKWFFIQGLPLGALVMFGAMHVVLLFKKRCIQGRKRHLNSHVSALIAMFLVSFYFLFLYLSKTTLDVFNCSPTDPPDGNEYLEVVFEPCWEAGGIQMTLLPFAFITLIAYSMGYPAICGLLLKKHRLLIMEDQLLRARDTGRTRLTNPNCYDIRKRYHRIYYHFRPDRFYWVLFILLRKWLIAFTSLMFNKNPAFQLSVALLVMFGAYAMQVKHRPYLSPSGHEEELRQHRLKVQEGDAVHAMLDRRIQEVMRRGKRKARGTGWNSVKKEQQSVGTRALTFFWEYNTVEQVLLASAVLVNLAGVMFESNRFQGDFYSEQRDAVTVFTLLIIFASVLYFFTVLFSEIFVSTCGDRFKKKDAGKGKGKGKGKGASSRKLDTEAADGKVELVNNAAFTATSSHANPLLAAGPPAAAGSSLSASERQELDDLRHEVIALKAENRTLNSVMQAMPTGRNVGRNQSKRQFGQRRARDGEKRGRGRRVARKTPKASKTSNEPIMIDSSPAPPPPTGGEDAE